MTIARGTPAIAGPGLTAFVLAAAITATPVGARCAAPILDGLSARAVAGCGVCDQPDTACG